MNIINDEDKILMDIRLTTNFMRRMEGDIGEFRPEYERKPTIITESNRNYDKFKTDRYISMKEVNAAIELILQKFIQDQMGRLVIDLDIWQPHNDNDIKIEHQIMKRFIKENGLWDKFLNDDEFNKYLREEYKGDESI